MSLEMIQGALFAAAGLMEATRGRWFPAWHAVPNPGVVFFSPQFGFSGEAAIPPGYNLESSVTRQHWFYPQAGARFAAQYGLQILGLGANVWVGAGSAIRLFQGDSAREGETIEDSALFVESLLGVLSLFAGNRLMAYRAGSISLIAGSLGALLMMGKGIQQGETPHRAILTLLGLSFLNFSLGGCLTKGIEADLARDLSSLAKLRRLTSASHPEMRAVKHHRVETVKYAREVQPGISLQELPWSVDLFDMQTTRYHFLERVGEGGRRQRCVGYLEVHEPHFEGRRVGLPEVTVKIFPPYRDDGRTLLMREALRQRYPDDLPAWITQTTAAQLDSGARYQRTLPRGLRVKDLRVTASVAKCEWTHDGISGKPFLLNSPIKIVRQDHRVQNGWVRGRVLNTLDSARDYRLIFRYLREAPRGYPGLAAHPQRPPFTARAFRFLVGRRNPMLDRPTDRAPLPQPRWWRDQWRRFHGQDSPPIGAGDWETLPSADFLRRWGRRKEFRKGATPERVRTPLVVLDHC